MDTIISSLIFIIQSPQPPDSWQGIRDGTQEASESLSKHMIFQFEVGSEYCLYLNVYTPRVSITIYHTHYKSLK